MINKFQRLLEASVPLSVDEQDNADDDGQQRDDHGNRHERKQELHCLSAKTAFAHDFVEFVGGSDGESSEEGG